MQEEEMFRFISRGSLIREAKDVLVWKWDAIREFSVKSAYECLANFYIDPLNEVFK